MQFLINLIAFIMMFGFSIYFTFCTVMVVWIVWALGSKHVSDKVGAGVMAFASIICWYITYITFGLL
jgi:hypothetical protein